MFAALMIFSEFSHRGPHKNLNSTSKHVFIPQCQVSVLNEKYLEVSKIHFHRVTRVGAAVSISESCGLRSFVRFETATIFEISLTAVYAFLRFYAVFLENL
jgi:hypothetical protein